MTKKKYYAVIQGRKPGIYDKWFGEDGAQVQINEFPHALYKGFSSFEDAAAWLKQPVNSLVPKPEHGNEREPEPGSDNEIFLKSQIGNQSKSPVKTNPSSALSESGKVIIYTDGGCLNNPGPGGYGVVLLYGKHRKEVSGGFRLTTNNRMELMACIVGLKQLKRKCAAVLYSDSKYVVNGITKGWAKRWQANHWMRNKTDRAENKDLWGQLLDLCNQHEVQFIWVKGHAGNPENERCDQLAAYMSSQKELPSDKEYEKNNQ